MPSRTQILKVFPWAGPGGVVTSRDNSELTPNQMIIQENYYRNPMGDHVKRDGINFNWDSGATGVPLLDGTDFIRQVGTSKVSLKVTIDANGQLYSYTSGGVRTALVDGGTPWTDPITQASFLTYNNKLLIAVDGDTNVVKQWDGVSSVMDLPNAPLASVLTQHLERVWCNDKTFLDRVQYSQTGNETIWQGAGDSGALDIGVGDGDPSGLTTLFPTFQGVLFIAKRTKLYNISGGDPTSFSITNVSNGIGCLSQRAFATIDQQDIIFASERGFHQMTTTLNYGNFQSSYISADIQDKFQTSFDFSRRQYIKAIYIPQISSVGFAVTDESYGSAPYNNILWLYNLNTTQLAWHAWPLPCECLFMSRDADNIRPYFGTTSGRLAKGFNGTFFDINEAGVNVSIPVHIRTGRIFVDGRPEIIKAFKRFGLLYRPTSSHNIQVTLTIDNSPSQILTFDQTQSLALLGETFILDSSILGSGLQLAPFSLPFDGYGRGITIDITSTDVNVSHTLMGFTIEFETAETSQESQPGALTP